MNKKVIFFFLFYSYLLLVIFLFFILLLFTACGENTFYHKLDSKCETLAISDYNFKEPTCKSGSRVLRKNKCTCAEQNCTESTCVILEHSILDFYIKS